jgi:hypothetical protein
LIAFALGLRGARQLSKPSLAALAAVLLTPGLATAQDCPTAQSGAHGFVVERNEAQKTDVFHSGDGIVRTIMRFDGKTLLEKTLFEGVFELERLDRGKRTKYEPRSDLKPLFPLKPGLQASAKFISEVDGKFGRLYVELAVKKPEDLYVGPCKYSVLRIERSESVSAVPPQYVYTDLYSPDLKLVLGREYKRSGGKTELIKFDRIYPLKN